jgi:hypothetical protein
MAQYRIRPSKVSSCIGVIVGIGMLIFFLSEFKDSGPASSLGHGNDSFIGFGLLFVIVLVCIIGYHAFNAFSDRGVAHEVIDVENRENDIPPLKPTTPLHPEGSEAERLRKLEGLRNQNLISEVEYKQKRQEILDDL